MTGAVVLAFGLLVGSFAWSAYSDLRPTDVWRDRDGKAVPDTKVSSHVGPEHCDWQSVTFLELPAGSGLAVPALSGQITFLRDPEGSLSDYVLSPYDATAELPSGAVDTGWARDGQELWLEPDGWAAYFEVDGDEFEVATHLRRHLVRLTVGRCEPGSARHVAWVTTSSSSASARGTSATTCSTSTTPSPTARPTVGWSSSAAPWAWSAWASPSSSTR